MVVCIMVGGLLKPHFVTFTKYRWLSEQQEISGFIDISWKPTISRKSHVLLRTIIRFKELRYTLDSENYQITCYSTHLEAEAAYFLHVSALSSNSPNTPIRLDHHTGIKVSHLPFLTSKRIRSWCDNPLEFARHFWRFR